MRKTKGIATKRDKEIGEVLRSVRLTSGYSLENFALLLDVSYQQLQKYERGSNRISASKLFDLCDTLDIDPKVFSEKEVYNTELKDVYKERLLDLIKAQNEKFINEVSEKLKKLK